MLLTEVIAKVKFFLYTDKTISIINVMSMEDLQMNIFLQSLIFLSNLKGYNY